MALIVEDGSQVANAESYATVAYADTYLDARGYYTWATMTTTEKEQALRRATDYMTQAYRQKWAGYMSSSTQALDWPRYDVPKFGTNGSYYLGTEIPADVKKACAELAFKAASGALLDDLEQGVTSETVGQIEVTYDSASPQTVRYMTIDRMLAPLLSGGGGLRAIRS